MNSVSDTKGPLIIIPNFFKTLIEGIIIFFSSDPFLNSALCGFSPITPIFGFFLNIFLYQALIVFILLIMVFLLIFLETDLIFK